MGVRYLCRTVHEVGPGGTARRRECSLSASDGAVSDDRLFLPKEVLAELHVDLRNKVLELSARIKDAGPDVDVEALLSEVQALTEQSQIIGMELLHGEDSDRLSPSVRERLLEGLRRLSAPEE